MLDRQIKRKKDKVSRVKVEVASNNFAKGDQRPYTPRHNGKVERSHQEDQKRFYDSHSFYSLNHFAEQLAIHNQRSNNFPMRPLGWLSPIDFTVQHL